ncbi:MAG: altronate dehydratase family protein [Spirochaetales bacterium]|nr:altronate dehydratase family protein [Spirochaetales bacterium]
MNNRWIKISPKDNVIVALEDLKAGDEVSGIILKTDIPAGHKASIQNIASGEKVIKYGFPIGKSSLNIEAGMHVHTHNLKTLLDKELEYNYSPSKPEKLSDSLKGKTFMGYHRTDGRVGTRNEIWIINTVGCVNKTAERLARLSNEKFSGRCDGIFTFTHPYGCSQLGEDHQTTSGILADLVKHPNAGGVLVLGLGCENNNIPLFKKLLVSWDEERVKFLTAQEVDDEIEEGLNIIEEIVKTVEEDKRELCPLSSLVVGMKCGGSDGLSGITANPLVGCFSDLLVAAGGTSILTEVPEMFGAETILMNRCESKELFEKTVSLINNFKEYFISHNQVVYENPSPGNKDGGITSLEDKSLGCIQKGGRAPVSEVLQYGERTRSSGLTLLSGPGNDIVSTTALTAAGSNIILFTTGRGTPLGAPVPTVKISTNSRLAKRKSNWIDFDAGVLVDGRNMDEVCLAFADFIISIASGKQAMNEKNDYREIAIFKDGVTL